MKVTAFLASILTVSPVLGLRPSRAALSDTANVPKPTSGTLSPLTKASVIAANVASIALVESALVNPVAVATASTNSTFFIYCIPPYNLLSNCYAYILKLPCFITKCNNYRLFLLSFSLISVSKDIICPIEKMTIETSNPINQITTINEKLNSLTKQVSEK